MGERVVVRVASVAERGLCFGIRRRVFVHEQRVPLAEDQDGLDEDAVHFLASLDGEPVGTARLRVAGGTAKAQRVAVLPDLRRGGVGRALMAAVEAEAHRRGLAEVVLHAQVPVIPFYERLGYTAEGDVFFEAEIPHRRMRRRV